MSAIIPTDLSSRPPSEQIVDSAALPLKDEKASLVTSVSLSKLNTTPSSSVQNTAQNHSYSVLQDGVTDRIVEGLDAIDGCSSTSTLATKHFPPPQSSTALHQQLAISGNFENQGPVKAADKLTGKLQQLERESGALLKKIEDSKIHSDSSTDVYNALIDALELLEEKYSQIDTLSQPYRHLMSDDLDQLTRENLHQASEKLFASKFRRLEGKVVNLSSTEVSKSQALIGEYRSSYRAMEKVFPVLLSSQDKTLYAKVEQRAAAYVDDFCEKFKITQNLIKDLQLSDIGDYLQQIIDYNADRQHILKHFDADRHVICDSVVYEKLHTLVETFKSRQITGIRNVGNFCYANAALQALLAQPSVVARIRAPLAPLAPSRLSHHGETESDFQDRKNKYEGQVELRVALNEFYEAYSSLSTDNSAKEKSIEEAASRLRQAFFDAKLTDWSIDKLGAQQDSEEFLNSLLSFLGMQLALYQQEYTTDDHSGIQIDETNRYLGVNTLMLPVSLKSNAEQQTESIEQEDKASLQDLVEHFYGQPRLVGREIDGRDSTDATQNYIRGQPPQVLVMKLDCFGAGGIKKTTDIQFPEDGIVNLHTVFRDVHKDVNYRVAAVIDHKGEFADSGHYTARVKRELADAEGGVKEQWFEYDDSEAAEILDVNKTSNKDAYCVFLELCADSSTEKQQEQL